MEQPVTLKKQKKCKQSKDSSGKQCIVHFESTPTSKISLLSEHTFNKIKETAAERLKLQNPDHRLEHLSNVIPDTLDHEIHGTHTRCYRLFTNTSKIRKRQYSVESPELPSCSKKRCSVADTSKVLFAADKCLFCEKNLIKVKGIKQNLAKCVTKCAEDSIREAAIYKNDEAMLLKIRDRDLVAREAHYHHHCRRKYTRSQSRNILHETSGSAKLYEAHNKAFQYICSYVEDHIVLGQNVERMTMIRERYLNYMLDNYPYAYNENYKTYKLKNKLIANFHGKINFWQPNFKSELVYAADIEGQAIEAAFELAASDEKRLQESAFILRRHILNAKLQSAAMPWPPSSSWLLSDECKPPSMLKTFIINVISSRLRSSQVLSSKTDRYASSIAEDICFAVTNGEWVMSKHMLLPMTVRHLTGSAELITILNRFGHGQSYSKTIELETAMCNSVTTSESVLPQNISVDNNAVLHFCWDNFDLNEETPSGAGTTHSTHGIAIQEVRDSNYQDSPSVVPLTPKTKQRSVRPQEVQMKDCFAKLKVEPLLNIHTRKPQYDFDQINLQSFTWLVCREVGSHFDNQTVPPWSGWLSKTAESTSSNQSTVEYMAPINASINENTTVQHILEASLIASHEVGQEYAIVTFDLAVAKKAYSLVWQTPELCNIIVRMGVFHTLCSLFGTIGKLMKGSGLCEIVLESGVCASGSLDKVMSGKHYNRALRVHKLMAEGMERLLLARFQEMHSRSNYLKSETEAVIHHLTETQSSDTVSELESCTDFINFYHSYKEFKSAVRSGQFGKTAMFWLQYIDIVDMVLVLIRATKENNLDLHVAALYKLCPLFFALDHNNYARYIPVYLLTIMNLDTTHPGAKALLKKNGFSVSRSSVPRSRNAVDITIEQTINRHAKTQGGIIGFSRNYSAYYRWCMTRHMRAKYVEATLISTDMISEEESCHRELQPAKIQGSEEDVQRVVAAVGGFLNPFSGDNSVNCLYCLSSGVPASTDIADSLLDVMNTGQRIMDEFIDTRLIKHSSSFHDPLKRTKMKTFATAEVSKKITSPNNKLMQIRAERNIFGQLIILDIQHNIDLELTLSYPLGPVPWSLATSDGMPVKTDKAKLLHIIESSVEPTTNRPKTDVVHVIDGNAMMQSLTNVPSTFEEVAYMLFKQLPRTGRTDFVTDTYLPQSIKSYERRRRGTTQTLLLQGPKTKTPRDWKGFLGNEENKTQLIQLIFNQWKSDAYAAEMQGRCINYVIGEECYQLSGNEDGTKVHVVPQEDLFSSQEEADTRIILHCLNIASSKPQSTIIVRSPDTDVMILLVSYIFKIGCTVLFDTGTGNKRRLLNVNNIAEIKGEDISSILPAIHSLTGCDTTSAFVRRGKVAPLKLVEKHQKYRATLKLLGQSHDCSVDLISGIEALVCAIYGQPRYDNINKLRYDQFMKRFEVKGQVINSYNGIDMSLLPPCKSSLEMHIRRVNYQVYVWIHSHEQYPHLPKVDESGWNINAKGQIEYEWVKDNIVPKDLVEILSTTDYDCNTENDDDDDPEMSVIDAVFDEENDSDDD